MTQLQTQTCFMSKKSASRSQRWTLACCIPLAEQWVQKLRKRKKLTSEFNSLYWHFVHAWQQKKQHYMATLIAGKHEFSPMRCYRFAGAAAFPLFSARSTLPPSIGYLRIKKTASTNVIWTTASSYCEPNANTSKQKNSCKLNLPN